MRNAFEQVDIETVSLMSDNEINAICEPFEDELRAGRSPRIEDYCVENLAVVPRLLAELIALELEYLRERDPSFRPDPAVYQGRFPAHHAVVVDAISTFQAQHQIPPERWIGRYELLEELGRGGFGVVYRARREGLEGAELMVALKLILPARLGSYRDVESFVDEVRKMVRLSHRGVLSVFDSGEDRGQPYMAMKLVGAQPGANPQDPRFAQPGRGCPPRRGDRPGRRLPAPAPHRPLRPEALQYPPRWRTAPDHGLRSESSPPGRAGGRLHRPEPPGRDDPYMAPEQVRGEPSKASDIYSLGAILFELLTGRTPFGSGPRALHRIINEEAMGPRQFNSGVPPVLDAIVRKCLRKDPCTRYETATQLAAELERFLRKEPMVHTPADTVVQSLYQWAQRHRELACRLIGIGSALALTQFNYFVILKEPALRLHLQVTVVELLWMLASVVLDRLLTTEEPDESLRRAWAVIDVTLLTVLLGLLDAVTRSYVVGYPLLIAFSGLWSRVRLVWWTTVLCFAGYAALVIEHRRGMPWTGGTKDDDPNVVLAIILVTGYVIALQVERARAALNAVQTRRS